MENLDILVLYDISVFYINLKISPQQPMKEKGWQGLPVGHRNTKWLLKPKPFPINNKYEILCYTKPKEAVIV